MRPAAAGAAATVPIPVIWDLFGLGYRFEAGPFVVSVAVVLITRLCVYLNTNGRRQIALDIAVTGLCSVIAALWTQAHSLDLLPAAISAMTIAGIGYGLIGMAKSQVATALREAAGVLLNDLMLAADRPRTLFEGDTAGRERLMAAIDDVNGRFGKFTAVTASQGFRRQWRLRSEMRSPAWTTRLDEVPIVRA